MFYRWAQRLESTQLPATAFPAAAPEPADGEESHELDSALIAAAIASVWVLLNWVRSGLLLPLDWAVITYAPIFLVATCGALLVRAPAPFRSIAAHVAAYGAIAALMGWMWIALGHAYGANLALEVIAWGAFFALLGLVVAVLCVVAWAAALRQLATPLTVLHNHARGFRLLCVVVILGAALVGTYQAMNVPLAGL